MRPDRKSTRLNSSHTEIYTLSLHDALPIYPKNNVSYGMVTQIPEYRVDNITALLNLPVTGGNAPRSEEHTSELQSHRDLHSFPTRRSSDLPQEQCVLRHGHPDSGISRGQHNRAAEPAGHRRQCA